MEKLNKQFSYIKCLIKFLWYVNDAFYDEQT